MKEKTFWDNVFTGEASNLEVNACDFDSSFLGHIGDPAGLRCLDIGCGSGELSCLLAQKKASVVGVDGSSNAISIARKRAETLDVSSQTLFIEADLMQLGDLFSKEFDLVVGKFVLHHLEPFDKFLTELHGVMKDDGEAVFFENSSDNAILMWARRNIVGRFGIPKFGDDDEVPLSAAETDMAKKLFDVTVSYPNFVFFSLASTYLLRNLYMPGFIKRLPSRVDQAMYHLIPPVRRFSYHKIVSLRVREAGFG